MITNEVLDKAIESMANMIEINIHDISKGAVYARTESQLCLNLIALTEKFEAMKTPVKVVTEKVTSKKVAK